MTGIPNRLLGLLGLAVVRSRSLEGLSASARTLHRYRVSQAEVESFFHLVRPVSSGHELVRIGGHGDGGYLVPDDLDGIAGCLSPGVGDTARFEADLAKRGIPCWLYDDTVDACPATHRLFHFEKLRLGPRQQPGVTSIDAWAAHCLPAGEDGILQMDIEGDEYEILMSVSDDALQRFRILVIEFHFLGLLFSRIFLQQARHVFERLAERFEIVHLHPNNTGGLRREHDREVPEHMEITFLRKDRVRQASPRRDFPHALDEDNVAGKPALPLPACWYER